MKLTSTQIIGFIVAFLVGVSLTSYVMRDKDDVDTTEDKAIEEVMEEAEETDEAEDSEEGGENEEEAEEEAATPAPVAKKTVAAPVVTTPKAVTGNCSTGLSARKDSKLNAIVLNWASCESDNFQFYKLVKSSKNANPSFPADPVAFSSSNKNASNFVDKTVAGRTTYYYRMCVVQRLGAVNCSNVASSTY